MIVAGILLEVLAAAVGTTSKQLIAHGEFTQQYWMFKLGAFMNMVVGPIIDASAYAFAPQVVIAPFVCLDVIFNVLTAPYTLSWQREKLTEVHVAATVLVAIGAGFTAVCGSVRDEVLTVYDIEERLVKPQSIAYIGTEVAFIGAVTACLRARVLSPTVRSISLGGVAGLLVGNVFCMKGVINILRNTLVTGNTAAWSRPTPYMLLVGAVGCAISGHLVMRRALGENKAVFIVTIFEGAHICGACLSGCIVMEEMRHAPWLQYSLYWMAVSIIIIGMALINTSAADSKLDRSLQFAQSFPDERSGFAPREFRSQYGGDTAKVEGRVKAVSDPSTEFKMNAPEAVPGDGWLEQRAPSQPTFDI